LRNTGIGEEGEMVGVGYMWGRLLENRISNTKMDEYV
jgi:hypothetical protein